MVRLFIQHRLIRQRRDGQYNLLTFAVSDRFERTQGWNAAAAALQIDIELQALFAEPSCPYTGHTVLQHAYGKGGQMHYFVVHLRSREWAEHISGFVPQLHHVDV